MLCDILQQEGQEDQHVEEHLPGTLFTGTLSHTRKKGGDVVSGLRGFNVR